MDNNIIELTASKSGCGPCGVVLNVETEDAVVTTFVPLAEWGDLVSLGRVRTTGECSIKRDVVLMDRDKLYDALTEVMRMTVMTSRCGTTSCDTCPGWDKGGCAVKAIRDKVDAIRMGV